MLLVASQLQRHFSEVDCICRLSESQFVIAIEGATNISQLSKSCAHILAATKTADPLLPVGRTPKLHLTCALMPKANPLHVRTDAQAILAWLIECSEAPRNHANQAVRTLGF
jgi:GGDEF domain-containing protein